MVLESDAFYDGEQQTGVLLRDVGATELATFVGFTLDPPAVYHAEQLTQLGPQPTDWTGFRFAESPSGTVTEGARTASGSTVDAVVVDRDAVPSYLAYRVLVDLARRSGDRAGFRQFDEHGDPGVQEVEFVRREREQVVLPGERSISAERYDLILDGEPYTSHWWDGASVVANDWTAGSMSVRARDLEQALADCPVPVARLARAWVAGRTPD